MDAFNLWSSKPSSSSSSYKSLIKLADLPFGEYPVKRFYWTETSFGAKIKLDLGDKYVFLPPSISKNHTAESVKMLNTIAQTFIWNGYGENQFEP